MIIGWGVKTLPLVLFCLLFVIIYLASLVLFPYSQWCGRWGKCCLVAKGNTVQKVFSWEHVARKQVCTWIHFGPCGSICHFKVSIYLTPQKWITLTFTQEEKTAQHTFSRGAEGSIYNVLKKSKLKTLDWYCYSVWNQAEPFQPHPSDSWII